LTISAEGGCALGASASGGKRKADEYRTSNKNMEAIKKIVRVSKNHEITTKVPSHISENEPIEIILIFKKKPDNYNQKIKELKETMTDNLFLNDISAISEDFKIADLQSWE
jgi:hypothetical protein